MGILSIDYAVDSTVDSMLAGLEVAISSTSLAVWLRGDARQHLKDRAESRFAGEGDDVSGPWVQLAPATIADREAKGFPGAHPILKRTGSLEAFIENAGITVVSAGDDGIELDTTLPTSATLMAKLSTAQKGSGRTPARPVLGLNGVDAELLLASLEVHIETLIAGASL